MANNEKKRIRLEFRTNVFDRDGHRCRACGHKPNDATIHVYGKEVDPALDAHHITDRTLMPHGGYVKENGISLCGPCHEKAEVFHSTGTALPGWAPEDLYKMIGSSYEQAIEAAKRLK
jgi:5-methylcytosine-specific restriction endonuclease McrA